MSRRGYKKAVLLLGLAIVVGVLGSEKRFDACTRDLSLV